MNSLLLNILGPFGWPNHEDGLPSLPSIPGVYLMTVECHDGFLPYGVGVTRRPVVERFKEHTRSFVNGEYNILDQDAAKQGARIVLWKGWGWTPEKRADYADRKNEIISLAESQLAETRIFVVETGTPDRILERIEAAIANHYYKQDHTLIDRGMHLEPRWELEDHLSITFQCASNLLGLPLKLDI